MQRLRLGLLCVAAGVAMDVSAPSRVWAADPAIAQCVAANEQAGPLRQAGKLREARANLLRCSAASCPAVVRNDCIAGATQLDAAIPTLVFVAQDAAGNDVGGVRVTMDGQPLATALDGTALDVDPGEHVFTFTMSGAPTVEKHLILRQAEKNRRERIVLQVSGAATAAPPTVAPATVPPTAPATGEPQAPVQTPPQEPNPPLTPSTWSGQKTIAIIVAGVGLAGIAVGSVFGLKAHSSWQQAQNDCAGGCSSGSTASSEADTAHTDAKVSDATFGIGAGALIAGVALWILAPSAKAAGGAAQVHPLVGQHTTGLAVSWSLW